jgi:hypothetical protein
VLYYRHDAERERPSIVAVSSLLIGGNSCSCSRAFSAPAPCRLPRLVVSRAFAMLSLLSLSFCSCTAQAQGYYTSTYSGGTTTVITTSPPSPTQKSVTPYSAPAPTNAPGSWGGGSFTYIDGGGGSGSVTCAGEITATFIWNGGTNNDPAPTVNSVVVSETVNAAWQTPSGGDGSGTGTSGGGSDIPNGGTPASQPPNYTATRYTANGGSGFSVNATPSAFMSGSSPHPYQVIGGNAYVGYVAAAFPVTISFAGTTLDSSHKDNIPVGQGCTASLVGVPVACTVSNWQWSVDGNIFQNWTASASSASLVKGIGPSTSSTAHWYWSDVAGYYNVTCTATVTPPAGQGLPFQVTATKKVHLYVPQTTELATTGRVQINNLAQAIYGSGFSLYAGDSANQPYGIIYTTQVNTPALFSSGIWMMVQLVTPNTWTTPLGQSEQPAPGNGVQGLDTRYPFYPSSNPPYITGVPANNLMAQPYDGPGVVNLQNTIIRYRVSDNFATFVMFLPPGSDTQWVPVWWIGWYWNADDSIPGAYWAQWNNANDAGIVRVSVSAGITTHPIWNVLVH